MSKTLRNFANECVDHYATYDKCDEFYCLDVEELPDFVQHEFAALIIGSDEAYACEASGPDNKHWDNKMLPALTRYLANSTDKDEAIEFNRIWRDCITDYLKSYMQELIMDSLSDFNSDNGYTHDMSWHTGIAARGPI